MEKKTVWRVMGALCAAATMCATGCACAQQEMSPAGGVGDSTRDWLALQRDGKQAAPALGTLGAEASLAYARYMDSFRTKIPVSFGSSLGTGGGAPLGGSTDAGALPRN